MKEKLCFVAIEFPDDKYVAGYVYWYLCPFAEAQSGMKAVAPLGRHNNLQTGVIREVMYATKDDAPYPVKLIKSVQKLEPGD